MLVSLDSRRTAYDEGMVIVVIILLISLLLLFLLKQVSSIKFWKLSNNNYRLCSQMDNPHSGFRVTDLALCCCCRSEYTCASAAVDGSVKIWKCYNNNNNNNSGDEWRCIYSFKYRDCPGIVVVVAIVVVVVVVIIIIIIVIIVLIIMPTTTTTTLVSSCCFSGDGSVLAVAHQNLVSLWDPVTVAVAKQQQ